MENPSDLPDMPALRAAIDALDADLIALLARRLALIDRAAQIKMRDGLPARIDTRVEQVVANARGHAADAGLNPDLIEHIWRQLIENAIAREETLMKGDRT
ncbi:MAG: chorismate mutase [Paracoccus sp. (in: a-proteobacteria)]|uniref:chorismate mutase n=1 Tax=Paracoccus sp. TaxID=267 RepID=UPI0026DED493|nr:chorismate mutase [Paracoccus sp. (in: a-proteobacteria)]MDO5632089.1 chorismate mutase [Paracoccus sp. (in: a-proteobacteria)]